MDKMTNNFVRYECRCEILIDFQRFAADADITEYSIVKSITDDPMLKMIERDAPRIKFKSPFGLDKLLAIANNVVDGHVLFDTLELEENYTGDRKWRCIKNNSS